MGVALVLLAWALLTPQPVYATEYRQTVEIADEMQFVQKGVGKRKVIPLDPGKTHKH